MQLGALFPCVYFNRARIPFWNGAAMIDFPRIYASRIYTINIARGGPLSSLLLAIGTFRRNRPGPKIILARGDLSLNARIANTSSGTKLLDPGELSSYIRSHI